MYNDTGNVVWKDGGEWVGPLGEKHGGAFMDSFMTTSLMFAVSRQQAPESSESEINEQEPQLSTQSEYCQTGRWRGNKNKLG